MSDAMIELAPGNHPDDERRLRLRQEWGELRNGIDYETWIEGKLISAEDQRDYWRRRQRSDEDQLVRIANYFGKDARHAPDSEPTIAGMVIQEVNRLRALQAEIVAELYGKGFEVAGWHLNGDLEPLDTWFDDNGWCDPETWTEKRAEQPHQMLCVQHGGSPACEAENEQHGFKCPRCEE